MRHQRNPMKNLTRCIPFLAVLPIVASCAGGDAEKAEPATPPQIARAAENAPQPETPAPAPAEKPLPPPAAPAAPAVVEATPLAPAAPAAEKLIRFRCAYWDAPKNAVPLFVRDAGEIKRCELYQMAFRETFSVETPIVFYKKSGDVYEPCIQIDSRGFSDCIAIILPEFDPARPTSTAERGIQVFSAEEKDAPRGALVFYNWFNDALEAKISIRDADGVRKSDQTFTLKLGDHCVSLPAQGKRDICDLELSVGSGSAKRTLYASSMRLRDDQCTFFFAVPKKDAAQDGNARPDFKSFRIPR